MYIRLQRLCDAAEEYIKPYNDMCAYQINQKANRILKVFLDPFEAEDEKSIDAIITMAADSKIAIVLFSCSDDKGDYIKKKMKERLYTEIDYDLGIDYLCFGQFNFGLIYNF